MKKKKKKSELNPMSRHFIPEQVILIEPAVCRDLNKQEIAFSLSSNVYV